MQNNHVLAAAEGLPADAEYALLKAIYRYRADWNEYLAKSLDDDKTPELWRESYLVLCAWSRPATSWGEACEALKVANEEQEAGDGPLVHPMIKAALGWIQNAQKSIGARA